MNFARTAGVAGEAAATAVVSRNAGSGEIPSLVCLCVWVNWVGESEATNSLSLLFVTCIKTGISTNRHVGWFL